MLFLCSSSLKINAETPTEVNAKALARACIPIITLVANKFISIKFSNYFSNIVFDRCKAVAITLLCLTFQKCFLRISISPLKLF